MITKTMTIRLQSGLEARPVATLSIEAQERHERMEKTYDDEA